MEFYEVVAARRSFRSFKPDPVPADALERALRAASLAPSQMNEQPWRFVVLTGEARDRLCSLTAGSTRLLRDMFPLLGPERLEMAAAFLNDLGGAPAVIVVTYPDSATEYDHKVDLLGVGGSVAYLQLALTEEGLASVCITCAQWVEQAIRSELGLGDEQFAAVIPVGYPLGDPGERPPREDKTMHLEVWPG